MRKIINTINNWFKPSEVIIGGYIFIVKPFSLTIKKINK